MLHTYLMHISLCGISDVRVHILFTNTYLLQVDGAVRGVASVLAVV